MQMHQKSATFAKAPPIREQHVHGYIHETHLFFTLPYVYVLFFRGEHFSIELTYNHGVESYNIGDGLHCIGLRLPDLEGIVSRATAAGGEIISGPKARPCYY